ncbi:phosphonate transport system ATP-binding protein [Halohasta litchfieldiae]|jgi:phosphonate transport system ATP-binding protein|uniref:Phosphonate transport system ATP-binding protein n=1 Tax=Halohasta litchfieldiae TaxID=1073996 RepID=A0A1H6X294_9EURY|nr:phosphonate ABC transporter ATP-binding protein [Halohasta litchfieldiae]ATW88110.1 phosphonate transport system ATP-binding protein [Halohasta litchfieldiae]SEJ23261.1 phosphonate transport system ATP-binding protein [Halohasta litchfieldiae]
MSTLKVENLTKEYGDVTAVEDVSFEIEDEFVVLLGESGAGKSTLLRCVNGLTEPTSGGVYLDNEPLAGSQPEVGMIFQQHNLVDGVSAYLNALNGSLERTGLVESLFQWQCREDKKRALDALSTVGLLDEAHQRVSQMSGGQQQRVGIARALVQDPELLLADEPVASLDPSSAETVMGYLKKAAGVHEVTALVSLHQVNIAAHFGERFIGLRDGQLLFDCGPEDLTPERVDNLYGNVETVGLAETSSTEPVESNSDQSDTPRVQG